MSTTRERVDPFRISYSIDPKFFYGRFYTISAYRHEYRYMYQICTYSLLTA